MVDGLRHRRETSTLSGRSPSKDCTLAADNAFADLEEGSGEVRALSLDPDRYYAGEVLGQGGMGEVRRCRDRALDRDVALKVMRPCVGVDNLEERFLREARVQARLAHPVVVPVYDVGHDAFGRAFFTMKRVEGVTLDDVVQILREGRGSRASEYGLHRLLMAFARVCLAVDYAHARGVLHRDLKPANLMLGAFGEVYVLDWGLAKVTDPELVYRTGASSPQEPGDPNITEGGIAMGTPAYMAPEQAAARPLDVRADVFSLGAILFEILSLEPLLGETEIRAFRSSRPLSLLSRPSVRAPWRKVPAELDAICMRATAWEPAERYSSARALHDALEAFLAADEEQSRLQRLAAKHVARARMLSAGESADAARPFALEELGSALALAPEDPDARAELVHLLRHPPKTVPEEVEAQRVRQNTVHTRRVQRLVAAIFVVSWLVGYPVLLLAGGVNDVPQVLLVPAAWLLTGLVILTIQRRKSPPRISWSAIAASVAIAITSVLWGPLFIVPGLTVAIVFGQLLVATKTQRPYIVALKCLAIGGPALLTWQGVVDFYTPISGGGVVVHGALGSSRDVFFGGLWACHLFTLVFGSLFAARYCDVLDARVTENAVFSWQLANLVPRADDAVRSRTSLMPAGELGTGDYFFSKERRFAPRERGGGITGDGRYTRLKRLESNSVAEIWRCYDRRLSREVELCIARAAADDEFVRTQARTRGQLAHPAVAPLYDVGVTSKGRTYFTAKYVRGVKLERALRDVSRLTSAARERSKRRLLEALAHVCLAVAYAHEQGVFHGALSTSSIVLGSFGEVYVEGWGGQPLRASFTKSETDVDVWGLAELLRVVLEAHKASAPELEAAWMRATTLDGVPTSARALNKKIEAYLSGERDEQVRRELARTYLERARAASLRAFGAHESFEAQDSARALALREIGRAVRLQPDEAEARALLLRLITEPSSRPPPQVAEEVERLRQERSRGPAFATLFFCGLWLLLYPAVALLIGMSDFGTLALVWSSWALTELAMLHAVLRRRVSRVPWAMLATMIASMTTAIFSGPFLITPVLATLATMGFVLVLRRRMRYLAIALGTLVVTTPIVLNWLGPVSSADMIDGIVVVTGTLQSPSHAVSIFVLTIFHLLAVLFAAECAVRFRERLDAVEKAYLVRSWQLAKLLPHRRSGGARASRSSVSPR